MRHLTYTERLDKLKLWTPEERRNRSDLIEVYKNGQESATHTVKRLF